jgi:hypothetical protein
VLLKTNGENSKRKIFGGNDLRDMTTLDTKQEIASQKSSSAVRVINGFRITFSFFTFPSSLCFEKTN